MEYKFLINTSKWVILGYGLHFILLMIEVLLLLWLFIVLMKILIKRTEHASSMKPIVIPLIICVLIISPFVLKISFHFSFGGFLILIFNILFHRLLPSSISLKTSIRQKIVLFIALTLLLIFSTIERQDPLRFGTVLFLKANKYRESELQWQKQNELNSPNEDEYVGDIQLTGIDGEEHLLSDFWEEKPLALIMGANSCPPFSESIKSINELYRKYSKDINFLIIYLEEPHAKEEWWLGDSNLLQFLHEKYHSVAAIDISQAKSFEERQYYAIRMHKKMIDSDIPMVVDDLQNTAKNLFTGRPTRIYFIDQGGKVLDSQGPGPYYLSPAKLEADIIKYLKSNK